MKCDVCAKSLTEDDTYESILCGACNKNRSAYFLYCHKCKIDMKAKTMLSHIVNFFSSIKSFLQRQHKLLAAAIIFFFIDALIGLFSLKTAESILIGAIAIPTVLFIVFALLSFLGYFFYWVGSLTSDFFDMDLKAYEKRSGGPLGGERIVAGFIVVCILPILFYFVGTFVLFCFSRIFA